MVRTSYYKVSDCELDDYELMECIDDGLNLFGPSIRYTVYWRMTILHDIPRGGILVNPEAFLEELRAIFGAGAKRVESAILDKIKERSGLQYLESQNLAEVIQHTRKQTEELIDLDLIHQELRVGAAVPPVQAGVTKSLFGKSKARKTKYELSISIRS